MECLTFQVYCLDPIKPVVEVFGGEFTQFLVKCNILPDETIYILHIQESLVVPPAFAGLNSSTVKYFGVQHL